ncbi:hypothetical protein EYF80_031562 [Liparis tanakae]|uniref:Uncharacterized protein n=1 Tax=Liparis tanakae TaxID=230148 RepID=A0A4Z2GZY4_9TELE|nr:hypothetical protein EYF80_031562 [Liparis tanakae]
MLNVMQGWITPQDNDQDGTPEMCASRQPDHTAGYGMGPVKGVVDGRIKVRMRIRSLKTSGANRQQVQASQTPAAPVHTAGLAGMHSAQNSDTTVLARRCLALDDLYQQSHEETQGAYRVWIRQRALDKEPPQSLFAVGTGGCKHGAVFASNGVNKARQSPGASTTPPITGQADLQLHPTHSPFLPHSNLTMGHRHALTSFSRRCESLFGPLGRFQSLFLSPAFLFQSPAFRRRFQSLFQSPAFRRQVQSLAFQSPAFRRQFQSLAFQSPAFRRRFRSPVFPTPMFRFPVSSPVQPRFPVSSPVQPRFPVSSPVQPRFPDLVPYAQRRVRVMGAAALSD